MKNRAWISVGSEFLRDLLGLPKGTQIVRADMNGPDFQLRLGVQGEGLPEVEEGRPAPELIAIFRQEESDGERRVYCSFSHAPEKEWFVYARKIPAPASAVKA